MVRIVFATLMLAILSTLPSLGHAVENGTRVIVSDLSYWGLIQRLEAAIKRQKLKIISRASVRGAERQKKLGIPGNMVIGAFGDEYTTRILRANVAAGIEAPIRFYITRDAEDKTTTLWYRRPSWILARYSDKTGDLRAVGQELDQIMEAIAAEATKTKKQRGTRVMVKRDAGKPKTGKPKAKTAAVRKPPAAKRPKTTERVTTRTKPPQRAPAKSGKATRSAKAAGGAAPKPLASKTPETAATLNAPKPLSPAKPKTKAATVAPQQRAKARIETARKSSEGAAVRRRTPPSAKPDPDRDAISLTPLMLKLQGQ